MREQGRTTKSERTRARILEAASRLILERGGRDFQMAEVAELCDMSKGSLYYYFPDRDAIVEELFVTASDAFVARLEQTVARSGSAEEVIRSLIRAFCATVREDRLFVLAMASELHRGKSDVLPQLRERFDGISRLARVQLERAEREGIVRPGLDLALVADAICGAVLFGAARAARKAPEDFDVEATTEALYRFVLAGVGA